MLSVEALEKNVIIRFSQLIGCVMERRAFAAADFKAKISECFLTLSFISFTACPPLQECDLRRDSVKRTENPVGNSTAAWSCVSYTAWPWREDDDWRENRRVGSPAWWRIRRSRRQMRIERLGWIDLSLNRCNQRRVRGENRSRVVYQIDKSCKTSD